MEDISGNTDIAIYYHDYMPACTLLTTAPVLVQCMGNVCKTNHFLPVVFAYDMDLNCSLVQ